MPAPGTRRGKELGTVGADEGGEFVLREEETCTATPHGGSTYAPSVTATDLTAAILTTRGVSSTPWVC
jgi:hypothetical protein